MGHDGLKLTATDVAKLGDLYLHHGRSNTTQLVPAAWVHEATRPDMAFPDGCYGYQWWTLPVDGHKSFAALGYGGQVLWVIPDLKLILVILADPNGPSSNPVPFDVLRQELPDIVLPALP